MSRIAAERPQQQSELARTMRRFLILPDAPYLQPYLRNASGKNIVTLTVDFTNPYIPMDWERAFRKLHEFFTTLRSKFPDAGQFGGIISDVNSGQIRLFTESETGGAPVRFKSYKQKYLYLDKSRKVIERWLETLPQVTDQESTVVATMVCDEEWKGAFKWKQDGPAGTSFSWNGQPKTKESPSEAMEWLVDFGTSMLKTYLFPESGM
ncbi:hypothetical protein BO78DRAFT_382511 [Aspergillus sclerotiicarbonarius CBS 121057]|uniref:Uncharacterized protein n=1 Tax=Aspergillus sclerotiicarbonarius (strain CBS 121057 / IBT 28362) TaxID=1448318 RepID=A0A319ETA7_ASPSB|nr:hypothetical protein BO78DRAFT_382511 [Aspergillus sclerotiicarbonarius CBS 121057]